MSKSKENAQKGQKVALIATVATLFLAMMKGIIGVIFESDLLLADAFHSGADMIAIFASWVGLKLATKEKTEKFPYGFYKAETFAVFIISGFILWAGFELAKDGLAKIAVQKAPAAFPLIPLLASFVSVVAAFFIAHYEVKVGKEINSASLLANGKESYLDLISSTVVLAGIFLNAYNVPYVEGMVIVGIALMILKLGIENAINSILILMDANLNLELTDKIKETVSEIAGVKNVKSVKLRNAGLTNFVELVYSTNRSISVVNAHSISDDIEQKILETYDNMESVFVHVEPMDNEELVFVVPVDEVDGMESQVNWHFGRAPFFAVIEKDGEDVEIIDFYYNEFTDRDKHIGLNVAKELLQYEFDVLITKNVGEIVFHMLRDNSVDIYRGESEILGDILKDYQENELERLTEPTHSCDDPI